MGPFTSSLFLSVSFLISFTIFPFYSDVLLFLFFLYLSYFYICIVSLVIVCVHWPICHRYNYGSVWPGTWFWQLEDQFEYYYDARTFTFFRNNRSFYHQKLFLHFTLDSILIAIPWFTGGFFSGLWGSPIPPSWETLSTATSKLHLRTNPTAAARCLVTTDRWCHSRTKSTRQQKPTTWRKSRKPADLLKGHHLTRKRINLRHCSSTIVWFSQHIGCREIGYEMTELMAIGATLSLNSLEDFARVYHHNHHYQFIFRSFKSFSQTYRPWYLYCSANLLIKIFCCSIWVFLLPPRHTLLPYPLFSSICVWLYDFMISWFAVTSRSSVDRFFLLTRIQELDPRISLCIFLSTLFDSRLLFSQWWIYLNCVLFGLKSLVPLKWYCLDSKHTKITTPQTSLLQDC